MKVSYVSTYTSWPNSCLTGSRLFILGFSEPEVSSSLSLFWASLVESFCREWSFGCRAFRYLSRAYFGLCPYLTKSSDLRLLPTSPCLGSTTLRHLILFQLTRSPWSSTSRALWLTHLWPCSWGRTSTRTRTSFAGGGRKMSGEPLF